MIFKPVPARYNRPAYPLRNYQGKQVRQRLSKPHDARAVKSRRALREALLKLIAEKPFEQITIKDITAGAGVSYPTFFRQFSSREHLLESIAEEEIHHLLSLAQPVFDADTPRAALRVQCEYVAAHRELWTILLTEGAAAVMREEFFRIARSIGEKRESAGNLSNPWIPRELAASFVVSGLFEVLAWWLRQPKDYPLDNVVTLLEQLIVVPTTVPVDIRLID